MTLAEAKLDEDGALSCVEEIRHLILRDSSLMLEYATSTTWDYSESRGRRVRTSLKRIRELAQKLLDSGP